MLTVTQMLRKKGVVGKFVEFFGAGLDDLPLADRATIGNMAPEYGATCGFFPVDAMTIGYLRLSGRDEHRIKLVEEYCKAQGMWRDADTPDPVFTDMLELDMGSVEPSMAGPKRPQDRVALASAAAAFAKRPAPATMGVPGDQANKRVPIEGANYDLGHGDVVIAAITSCTNTSNPYVMIAAGLVARKARAKGLKPKPWVKTSLAPGSQVVTEYYEASGLQADLDAIGFQTVGYGCTTCIGNSGPLPEPIVDAIENEKLVVARRALRQPQLRRPRERQCPGELPGLAAAGGRLRAGRQRHQGPDEGADRQWLGRPAGLPEGHLADAAGGQRHVQACVTRDMFLDKYGDVFKGPAQWQAIRVDADSDTYRWNSGSTYVQNPPYFEGMTAELTPVKSRARRPHPGRARRQHHHRPHLARPATSASPARPANT